MSSAIEFESFIKAAGDAIIAVDIAGKITLWNPAAERIFGYSD